MVALLILICAPSFPRKRESRGLPPSSPRAIKYRLQSAGHLSLYGLTGVDFEFVVSADAGIGMGRGGQRTKSAIRNQVQIAVSGSLLPSWEKARMRVSPRASAALWAGRPRSQRRKSAHANRHSRESGNPEGDARPRAPLISQPVAPQAGYEFFLRAAAFRRVARAAEQLQVVDVVGSAPRLRQNVVDREVAEWERNLAAGADAFLTSEQRPLVSSVARKFAQIRAPGDVAAVGDYAALDGALARCAA